MQFTKKPVSCCFGNDEFVANKQKSLTAKIAKEAKENKT
jgi:hypothetical protein